MKTGLELSNIPDQFKKYLKFFLRLQAIFFTYFIKIRRGKVKDRQS